MTNFRWGIIAGISALFVSVFLGMVSGVGVFHIFIRALIFSAVFFGIGFGLRFLINSFFPELLYADDESFTPGTTEQTGAQINITLDSTGEYAVPELYKTSGDSQELGNIEDLISGVFRPRTSENDNIGVSQPSFQSFDIPGAGTEGIDRMKEAGYNSEEDGSISFQDDFGIPGGNQFEKASDEKTAAFQPNFTPSFGDDSGLGGLPDLDMMAMAFSSAFGSGPAASAGPAAAPSSSSISSASASPLMPPVEDIEPDRSRYTGNKPQTLQGDFNAKGLAEGIRTVLSKD